ncbi:uncharacterized protein LOC144827589 [Lissotriton helveticus]
MSLTQSLIQEAQNILQPPAPSASPFKEIKRTTVRSLMTVCGTISEVTMPPQETIDVEIYGVESTNGDWSTITTKITNTDIYQSMDVQNQTLIQWFMLDEEVDDIGEALIHYLPQICEVIFCNGKITKIVKEKSEED